MAADRSSFVRAVAWVVVFVAPAAALAGWFTPRPPLDRDEAVEVVLGALAEVDVDARVTADVVRSVHETEEGRQLDVWIVPTDVGDERIELRVLGSAGRLVYVDDRIGDDDTERLLTDDQFHRMGGYRDDATGGRWRVRNAAASVSAAIVAGIASVLATRSQRIQELP